MCLKWNTVLKRIQNQFRSKIGYLFCECILWIFCLIFVLTRCSSIFSAILFNCTDSLKNLIFDEAALMLATEDDDLHAIHSSCNSLLTILLVVCSPLDSLHTAVLDNYPNIPPVSASHSSYSINRELSGDNPVLSNEGYMCHWMRYIASKTFPFARKPITPADFEQRKNLKLRRISSVFLEGFIKRCGSLPFYMLGENGDYLAMVFSVYGRFEYNTSLMELSSVDSKSFKKISLSSLKVSMFVVGSIKKKHFGAFKI